MTPSHQTLRLEQVELIEGHAFSAESLARLCAVSPEWLLARVEAEVIPAEWREGRCYLSVESVWRVRQIAALEAHFDADPHLAGLVTDLMEELQALRRRLSSFER